MRYKIIEINNPIAVHALCDTLEGANRWININAVEYCSRGYFIDKTLTPESFKVEAVKHVPAKQKVQKVKTVLGYTPNPLLHKALAKQ